MNDLYCKEHGIFECGICPAVVKPAETAPVERGECAWSRSCTIKGPRLKVGSLFYCRLHADEFSAERVLISNTFDEESGEVSRNTRANPLMLFPRKVIDLAIHEAKKCRDGEPTDDALYQRAWIESEAEGREDLFGEGFCSFTWCCQWLSLDVAETRRRALEEIDAELAKQYLSKRRQDFSARAMRLWGYQPRPEVTPRAEQMPLFVVAQKEARA